MVIIQALDKSWYSQTIIIAYLQQVTFDAEGKAEIEDDESACLAIDQYPTFLQLSDTQPDEQGLDESDDKHEDEGEGTPTGEDENKEEEGEDENEDDEKQGSDVKEDESKEDVKAEPKVKKVKTPKK